MHWITASVKGKKPKRVPNQDRLLVSMTGNCFIAVMADGLGSAKHARLGAALACEAVIRALQSGSSANVTWADRISELWTEMVAERDKKPSDCLTTCSFVVVQLDQRIISTGVLGDTAVFVQTDGEMKSSTDQSRDFLNETECLGSSSSHFFLFDSHTYQKSFRILLATDGISEELEGPKVAGLVEHLRNNYFSTAKTSAGLLKRNIKVTFGPLNNDDKSMIFAWSGN